MRRIVVGFFLVLVGVAGSMTFTSASAAGYCTPVDLTIYGDTYSIRPCVPCLRGMCPYIPVPPPKLGGPVAGAVQIHAY